MSQASPLIRRLGPDDIDALRAINAMFGDAFDAPDVYGAAPPEAGYLSDLLANPGFVALAAFIKDQPIGALAAYELRKFEQARSEFFIYDLAVLAGYRRRGVATALIEALKPIAASRGGYVLIIQTETDNAPAIKLYDRLGIREEALSFDIPVHPAKD